MTTISSQRQAETAAATTTALSATGAQSRADAARDESRSQAGSFVFSAPAILMLGLAGLSSSEVAFGQRPVPIAPPRIRLVPPPVPLPPPPPLPRTIRPVGQANPPWFIPPHVAGDADFKGHGPRVELRVTLYIKPQAPNEVWATIEMDAVETGGDGTRASNWYAPRHDRVAVFARPVSQIVTPSHFGFLPDGRLRTFIYFDTTDKGVDTFNNPCACGLLNAVHFIGDQVGREAGTRTGVRLEFNPILAR